MTTFPPDGPVPDGENDPPPLTEADLEKFLAELNSAPETAEDPESALLAGAGAAEPPARYALVFTPVACAQDLAELCALSQIDILAVPTDTGVIAARRIAARKPIADWDISELLGGYGSGEGDADTEGLEGPVPAEAAQLAADLSALIRYPVVLVIADLATDVGLEAGLSGHVTATRYEDGVAAGQMSPGLLLAQADQVAEDLVLGRTTPDKVPGVVDSTEIDPGRGRGLFRRRR